MSAAPSPIAPSLVTTILMRLSTCPDQTYRNLEEIVRRSVAAHNATADSPVPAKGVLEEVVHLMNSLKRNPHPPRSDRQGGRGGGPKLEYCACGNSYATESELAKHKPKCWVLEHDANPRGQRACRAKAPADYAGIGGHGEEEEEGIGEREEEEEEEDRKPQIVIDQKPVLPVGTAQSTAPVKDRTCSICGFVSVSVKGVNAHQIRCMEKRGSAVREVAAATLSRRNCQLCTRRFLQQEELALHLRIEHGAHFTEKGDQRDLKCEGCGEEFPLWSGLEEHACGKRKVRVVFERRRELIGSGLVKVERPMSPRFVCPRCVNCFESFPEMSTHVRACCQVR